jgi:hypothetical protein
MPEQSRAGLYLALAIGTITVIVAAGSDELLALTYSVAESIVGLGR